MFSPLESMQGHRVLSFFSTKKKPAPNSEDVGRQGTWRCILPWIFHCCGNEGELELLTEAFDVLPQVLEHSVSLGKDTHQTLIVFVLQPGGRVLPWIQFFVYSLFSIFGLFFSQMSLKDSQSHVRLSTNTLLSNTIKHTQLARALSKLVHENM